MATTELDTLLIKIAADTASLRGEMAKANAAVAKSMQAMERSTDKWNASLGKAANFLKGAIMGALSALTVDRLASMVTETAKWADDLKTVADRLGITTDYLQELQGAGRLVNIEVAEMSKGMESFAVKFAEAAAGKGRGVAALKALGIDARDAKGEVKSLDVVLEQFADKIREFDRPSQLAIAKSFFGDDGALKFLDLLGQGSEKLRELREEARKGGVVVDSDLVAAGERFNKTLERMQDRIKADLRTAMLTITPVLDDWLTRLDQALNKSDALVKKFGAAGFGADLMFKMLDRLRDDKGPIGQALRSVSPGPTVSTPSGFEGRRAAEDASMRAYEASRGGTKVANLDPGAGKESELAKKLRELKEAANEARVALEQDPQTAGWVKLRTDLERLKATSADLTVAQHRYYSILTSQGLGALRDFGLESEHLARRAQAEAAGRKDLVAVLELEFQLRQRYGAEFVKVNAQAIEQMALQRHAIEENRRLYGVAMNELETLGRSAFEGIASALFNIGNESESLAERLRKVWINVLTQIMNKILELGVINPMLNSLLGGNRDTLGGILGAVFNIGGAALGGAGGFDLAGSLASGGSVPMSLLGFAGGGRPPMGRPSIVGEQGPELFVPDTPGTIVPNGAFGGPQIFIDARNANDPVAVEQAVARGIARAAPHLVNASVERVRDRAWRDPAYLPR